MQEFNMKQWLMENKSGMFSKTLNEVNPTALGVPQDVADAEMQQQDDENGDMVDNASMDVAAEAYGMEDMPDAEKNKIQTDKNGNIINATNDDGETFKVGSLVKDNNGRDTKVLGFKQNQGKVKAITSNDGGLNVSEWDINGLTLDEVDETVGYAMITKPADPGHGLEEKLEYDYQDDKIIMNGETEEAILADPELQKFISDESFVMNKKGQTVLWTDWMSFDQFDKLAKFLGIEY